MVKEEGFLALYKGLVPAVTQIGPQMGLQFGFYASFQDLWRQIFESDKHTKTGMTSSLMDETLRENNIKQNVPIRNSWSNLCHKIIQENKYRRN